MDDLIRDDKVLLQIRSFIIENFLFGNDLEMTQPEDSFMKNGIIDSLGILELVEFCCTTYNIEIEDDELLPENLDSLNNITRFIQMKRE